MIIICTIGIKYDVYFMAGFLRGFTSTYVKTTMLRKMAREKYW
jgi:hypothetical protein